MSKQGGSKFGLLGASTALVALMWSTAAVAQDAAQAAPQAEAEAAAADDGANDIVVTGSRIARPNNSSESPIVSVSGGSIENVGGTSVESILNRLPQTVATFGASSSENSRGGQESVNLRGLGPQRTLTLINGRRLVPANPDGSADVSIIPTALIDNIEIITGGASATYGSDAIAGVANFRLKDDFEGVEADVQTGITTRGDGASTKFSLTAGTNFAGGRGNVVVSASYVDRDRVMAGDRDVTRIARLTQTFPMGTFAPSATNLPTQAAMDAVFAQYGVAPGTVSRSTNLGLNRNGSLFTFNGSVLNYIDPGNLASDISVVRQGNSLFYNNSIYTTLVLPLKQYNVFARAHYDVSDKVTLYAEGLYSHYKATTYSAPSAAASNQNNAALIIPVTNPFISNDLRTLLASRPDPTATFNVNMRLDDLGARRTTSTYDNYQVTVGVKGTDLIKDWSWDIYASYGRSHRDQLQIGGQSRSRVQNLLQAPDGGTSLCAGGYNPFGRNPLSPACIAYIQEIGDALSTTVYDQRIVEASLQGGLFELPYGELRFAAGASYRRDTLDFQPDAKLMATDLVGFAYALPLAGDFDVWEGFGELLVPVLKDVPFFQDLSLSLGYRYSDHSASGTAHTYKISGEWEPFTSVRFRGGYQRAIRSPSLGELFSPPGLTGIAIGSPTSAGLGDPCDVRSSFRTGANAAQVRQLCIATGVPQSVVDSYQ